MFYIYQVDTFKYIRVSKQLKITVTSDIKKAAYWTSKSSAKTWESTIKFKFESAELKKAELKVVD